MKNKVNDEICLFCKNPYYKKRWWQKYCSSECRIKAHKERFSYRKISVLESRIKKIENELARIK